MVSGINPETRSVTVEWFERGETKGKEVRAQTEKIIDKNVKKNNFKENNP